MSHLNRRTFLQNSLTAAALPLGWNALGALGHSAESDSAGGLHIAAFRFKVSPPLGHSLCGGWIKPVVGYDDEQEAIGFVLLGCGTPIVVCAVDWTGLLNSAHTAWREALADAAGTTPERVAVQCVHQHNAPFACLDAQRIVAAYKDLPHIVDVDFFQQCLERGRKAVAQAVKDAQPVTHIGHGQGRVHQVASNRRFVGEDGKIENWRGSASRNPVHQELPEGLIDPFMKTVAFYNGEKKLVSCHYYATHPMSYYGDGRVCSEFVGIARKQRQAEEPDCTHIYFTGCAGNVAAGKYNDGSPEARVRLTRRIYEGMVASEKELVVEPVQRCGWETLPIVPPPRNPSAAETIERQIADSKNSVVARNRPAYELAWIRRVEQQIPIILSALHVNQVSLLHLPSESFIEYQLRAQQAQPDRFVATAAYGDGGPWYIPTAESYPQGGYEVSVAFCGAEVDEVLTGGLREVLGRGRA